jgi:hypothetical protein
MPTWSGVVAVFVLAVSTAASCVAPPASQARLNGARVPAAIRKVDGSGETQIYVRQKKVDYLWRDGSRFWLATGGDRCPPETRILTNKKNTWLNVLWGGLKLSVVGHARPLRPGMWAIYEDSDPSGWRSGSGGARLRGYAVQRTSRRWDVRRLNRTVAHTLGPDGPQAAAAFLLVC